MPKSIRSLRSVVDVMDEMGIEEYISQRSSRTCEFAVRMSGPRVINREEIEKIFEETASGDFAARWMTEWQLGHVPPVPHAPHWCEIPDGTGWTRVAQALRRRLIPLFQEPLERMRCTSFISEIY